MPFDGRDRIGRCALAGGENVGETILRDRIVLQRRLVKQGDRALLVLGDAVAVVERDGVFDFGFGDVAERCEPEQPHGLVVVLRHAASGLVQRAERILRVGIAGLRGGAQ